MNKGFFKSSSTYAVHLLTLQILPERNLLIFFFQFLTGEHDDLTSKNHDTVFFFTSVSQHKKKLRKKCCISCQMICSHFFEFFHFFVIFNFSLGFLKSFLDIENVNKKLRASSSAKLLTAEQGPRQ